MCQKVTFMSVFDRPRASALRLRSLVTFSFSALALSASNLDMYLLSAYRSIDFMHEPKVGRIDRSKVRDTKGNEHMSALRTS